MKQLFFIILSFACLLNSCTTYKKCVQKFGNTAPVDTAVITRVDTINLTDVRVDTAYSYVPGDTLVFTDTIPCPEEINKKISSKKGRVTATVQINNNKLTVICAEDSLKQVIINKEHTITLLKQQLTTITNKNKPFLEPQKNFFQRLPWWISVVMLLLAVGFVLLVLQRLLK